MDNDKKTLWLETIRMAWPAVLESFFVSLAAMIDTMMVSSLGTYAVAAIGLTTQPKFIALALFFSCNIAVSALVARRRGQGDRTNANEILLTAIVFVLISVFIITVLTVIFAPQIITIAGSNSDTHVGGVIYYRIIHGGMIFNVISLVINAAQRGSGNTKIAMRTNITSSIINVIFNYLLIGGHLGFPRLEVVGAALATVLGTVVASIMSIASLFHKNSYVSIPYMIKEKIKPSIDILRSITSLSSNFLIENFAMRVGFLTTALIAARLGTDPFAVHQVGMNFLHLGFAFGDGMQVAAVALIGRSLGEKNPEKAKQYGNICQTIGLLMSIVLAMILLLRGRFLFSLFFKEPSVLDMGVIVSRYIMIILLAQISQVVYGGCLRGAGDVKYCLFASLISVTLIRSVVTWVLTGGILNLGLHGIWIGILADQASRLLFLAPRFYQGKWVEYKI